MREEGWGQPPKVFSAWRGGEAHPSLGTQRSQSKDVGGAPGAPGLGDSG